MKDDDLENMKKCPSFEKCSQSLCPLDLELSFRSGGEGDRCRWMREPKKVKIKDKEFVSGGSVIPDALLNFVPQRNLKWLNEASRKRRLEYIRTYIKKSKSWGRQKPQDFPEVFLSKIPEESKENPEVPPIFTEVP